jgi:hypothetical protein
VLTAFAPSSGTSSRIGMVLVSRSNSFGVDN